LKSERNVAVFLENSDEMLNFLQNFGKPFLPQKEMNKGPPLRNGSKVILIHWLRPNRLEKRLKSSGLC